MSCRVVALIAVACCWMVQIPPSLADGLIADTLEQLRSSEIDFQRGASNAPFIPVASVSARLYDEGRLVDGSDNTLLDFQQRTLSASGLVPLQIGRRDAFFSGGWVSHSRFSANGPASEDFSVTSIGVPIGWLRQVNDRWQAAAFLMPLGHRSSQENSHWSLQTMGGAFARYLHSDRLWWAMGIFVDSGPDETYALPYAGASWIINRRWTLSAIMPWPAVIFAPSEDWMFRLGAAPAGATWTVQPEEQDIAVNLDTWNFGLSAERYIAGGIWLGLEAGVGGLRGLRLNVDRGVFDAGDVSVGSSGYAALSLRLRAR